VPFVVIPERQKLTDFVMNDRAAGKGDSVSNRSGKRADE
jgi:hypothetical protein